MHVLCEHHSLTIPHTLHLVEFSILIDGTRSFCLYIQLARSATTGSYAFGQKHAIMVVTNFHLQNTGTRGYLLKFITWRPERMTDIQQFMMLELTAGLFLFS